MDYFPYDRIYNYLFFKKKTYKNTTDYQADNIYNESGEIHKISMRLMR